MSRITEYEQYDEESFWRPQERPKRHTTVVLWALLLIGAVCIALAVSGAISRAHAHVGDRPDLDEWLMAQRNVLGGVCCNGDDTFQLTDSEWRIVGNAEKGDRHYQVFFEHLWHDVGDGQLTEDPNNRLPNALLWWYQGQVQCFKPAWFW